MEETKRRGILACSRLERHMAMNSFLYWPRRAQGRAAMAEHIKHSHIPTAASLFVRASPSEEGNQLRSRGKDGKLGAHMRDNQENEGSLSGSASKYETIRRRRDRGAMQHLRKANMTLMQKLKFVETENAERVSSLEKKLQQAIDTHREIEQRLRSQLQNVQDEQKAAVENARKVRTILTRVSSWVRQVQRAAHTQHPSLHAVDEDLGQNSTPRGDSTYSLWKIGSSLATNVQECQATPKGACKTDTHYPLHYIAATSYETSTKGFAECCAAALPPPAPGRTRVTSVPGKGFNYIAYSVESPSNLPTKALSSAAGEQALVADTMPSSKTIPRADTPTPKRAAGSLLAYCAQVVTNSLVGVCPVPSPHSKVMSSWKHDNLCPVREDIEIDEEAGQCNAQSTNQSQSLNVALPSLSIGLL